LENNRAKGQNSFDVVAGNVVVEFFNRNITPYPTEAGGPKFDLVPVTKQKDIMVNVARMHASQEYNRILELVEVLQRQAAGIKRRLDITDMVHSAYYQFQTYHGQPYWLAQDMHHDRIILTHLGPADWSTGAPENYQYIARVKWMGDYTWCEIDEHGNIVE
jgi:hypothetical protein